MHWVFMVQVKGKAPEPLVVVPSPDGNRVFELSDLELEHIGEWKGQKATGK